MPWKDQGMNDKPKLNQKFPACAQVARRLLAEVYGCQPGDVIPGEAELLQHARGIIETERQKAAARRESSHVTLVGSKAVFAVTMVEEIGGIFERAAPGDQAANGAQLEAMTEGEHG